jgi:hypothetical protein
MPPESVTRPRPRGHGANVLTLGGGLVAALLLAEAVLGLLDMPARDAFFQEFRGESFKLMCYDADPSKSFDIDLRDQAVRLSYGARFADDEFEQHWGSTPHAVEVEYNSHGYREREFTPRVDGVERIVVVGDSFTYGHGLPEPLSYPRLLETLLRATGERVEVLNLGVGGAELDRISRDAAFALRELDPDVLIYGYFLNDPRMRAAGEDVSPMLGTAKAEVSGSRFAVRAPGSNVSRLWDMLANLVRQLHITPTTLAWYRELHSGPGWQEAISRVRELQRRSERSGTRFIVLVLPLIWKLEGDYPLEGVHRKILKAGSKHGIEVIDALPMLRGQHDEDLFLHHRDRHPNPVYTRIVAETLARALRQ